MYKNDYQSFVMQQNGVKDTHVQERSYAKTLLYKHTIRKSFYMFYSIQYGLDST